MRVCYTLLSESEADSWPMCVCILSITVGNVRVFLCECVILIVAVSNFMNKMRQKLQEIKLSSVRQSAMEWKGREKEKKPDTHNNTYSIRTQIFVSKMMIVLFDIRGNENNVWSTSSVYG